MAFLPFHNTCCLHKLGEVSTQFQEKKQIYLPHNLRIYAILRLRCAFLESRDCIPISTLRTIVDIEDSWLTAQQRDERQEDNGDRRQHSVVSTALRHFVGSNFSRARREAHDMIHKCIPSNMNKYDCTPVRYHADAQELLRFTRHKTSRKPSVAHQYIALLTLPDRSMPPMEANAAYQGCLPSCKLNNRSLTVRLTGKVQSS